MKPSFKPENLSVDIQKLLSKNMIVDEEITKDIVTFLKNDCEQHVIKKKIALEKLRSFWPPRLVDSFIHGKGIVFFGAGMSVPCGIPGWSDLLSSYFGMAKKLLEDEDIKNDPLTMAELASQTLGHTNVQDTLRRVTLKATKFSINHLLLASLRAPIYITTNYDSLFEVAWNELNGHKIPVVVNDADFQKKETTEALSKGNSILFKIHGCASRLDEYLILTGKDYRNHYRLNDKFFSNIVNFLRSFHVLFLGFSHKDPGVSRLVEDIIYEFENGHGVFKDRSIQPHFFSLQFDMHLHTPEIFAARGLVALKPPSLQVDIKHLKTQSLGVALSELLTMKYLAQKLEIEVYDELKLAKQMIANELSKAFSCIDVYNKKNAVEFLSDESKDINLLDSLLQQLGPLGSQGVYLTNDQGIVVAHSTPNSIPKSRRKTEIGFSNRPYFQQAKSFRETFISDSMKSVFNAQSTFFVCAPVKKEEQFIGLLFTACQIGQWRTVIEQAEKMWARDISFLLIDSNGICLLPPNDEFSTIDVKDVEMDWNKQILENVSKDGNLGYSFDKLLALSQKDSLVRHIGSSVVPLSLDDDVLTFSDNYMQYSIISDIEKTRWKIALSIPIVK